MRAVIWEKGSTVNLLSYTNVLFDLSPSGMLQGAPAVPSGHTMLPQGGGPPGGPPQQLPKVYDGSPPPSPNHIMPHPIHKPIAQVKHI